MDANGTGSTRILQHAEEAKSPRRILVRSLLKSRNKLRAKYRELRAECKRWRNQAAAVERSRSTWCSAPWPGRRPPKENALSGLPSPRSCNRSGGNRRNVKRSWLRCVLNWSPPRERKKGALNQPEAHTAEPAQAMWASSVISPPESSTVAAAAHATDNTPVVEPPYPLPVRLATAPASENPDPLPATVSTRSTLPSPVGSHWPVWCVALAVRLVTAVKLSLRSTPRVLETVFGFLLGRTPETAVMAWTTVRCWLMRLGLYALLRPLKQADDWAYLIDHTVQIGEVKCFAVVGVQLSQLPYPHRCLQREDLELIALVPMVHSTAVTVEQALEEAALRTGIPRLIVSDQGGDVRGGIERYCRSHRHAIATCDTAHKGANLLRRLLEADERWARFVAQLSQTKAKLQQTSLACCVGPRLRPKARFMNLAAPLRWARWCLRVLDQPWPKDESLSDRQRAVLATIDRKQLEAKLGWLRDYRQAIDEWSQWHEVIQVVVRQARRHGIDRDSVAELQRQFTAMKLSPSGQETAEVMMEFIAEQAWVARLGGELLIVSTEILESLFGAYKNLEGQQSESGVTGLMLVVGGACVLVEAGGD